MKVLAPLDGSEESMKAMERGLALLQGADLDVTLLCVVESDLAEASEDTIQVFDEDETDEVFPNESSARRMLDRARARAEAVGVPVATRIVVGSPKQAILDAAADCDLLLMHSLHRSGLVAKLRSASSTESIARHVACSVMLVPGRD